MKLKKLIFSSLFLLGLSQIKSSNIVINFNPIPESAYPEKEEQISPEPEKPLLQKKTISKDLSGILVIYGGSYSRTDKEGIVQFIKKHSNQKIDLIITPEIEVKKKIAKTVAELQLPKNLKPEEIERVSFVKKKNENKSTDKKSKIDPEKKHWSITKMDNAQKRDKINKSTIIILDDPERFIIPTNQTPVLRDEHFFLPEIFVDTNFDSNKSDKVTLKNLEVLKHFEKKVIQEQEIENIKKTIIQPHSVLAPKKESPEEKVE